MTGKKRKSDNENSVEYMKRKMNVEEHDGICDRRLNWMKVAIYFIIGTLVTGGWIGYSQTEGMRDTNSKQTIHIQHNQKGIEKLEVKFDAHILEQKVVNKEIIDKLNTLNVGVSVIQKELEK